MRNQKQKDIIYRIFIIKYPVENLINKKISNHTKYRILGGKVKFASNAFFFEKGTANAYEKAKYGEFKMNDKHELLLVSMYDENLSKIKPK